MTIYSNDMKSYGLRNGAPQFLQMRRATACASSGWTVPGLAALPPTMRVSRRRFWRRSRTPGAPAVDAPGGNRRTAGPRVRFQDRGGLDVRQPDARLGRAADRNHPGYNEADSVLIAQLTAKVSSHARRQQRRAGRDHGIPNQRIVQHVVGLPWWESPCAREICATERLQTCFASESFIDELAVSPRRPSSSAALVNAMPAEDSGRRLVPSP